MKNKINLISICLGVVGLSLLVVFLAQAIWTDPTVLPPDGNVPWPFGDGGDITAIHAGAGLTGGGLSGSIALHAGAGTGIAIINDEVHATLGTSITGDEIVDGTITTVDLHSSLLYGRGTAEKFCGGTWRTIGPVQFENWDTVWAGGARWTVAEQQVFRNGVAHNLAVFNDIPRVHGHHISSQFASAFCFQCHNGTTPLELTTVEISPRTTSACFMASTGCDCQAIYFPDNKITNLVCGTRCTDLRW